MTKRHAIHMLWAHPRSVSTAFERIMRERGDLDVLHEPFLYYHYLHRPMREMPGFAPEPGAPTRFEDIRDMILDRAGARPVFAKDMAYYAPDRVLNDDLFLAATTHAFLVRDPAEAIVSYAKIDPEFTSPELGLIAQRDLTRALQDRGIAVHVILSETLRRDPEQTMARYWRFAGLPARPEALSWQAGTPKDWKHVQDWHHAVRSSTGIRPPSETDALAKLRALPARFAAIHEEHLPAYEELRAMAADQP